MRDELAQAVVPQIKELIARFELLKTTTRVRDWSDIAADAASDFVIGGMAAIYRASGRESPYAAQVQEAVELAKPWIQARIPCVGGGLKALLRDIESGYLDSLEELVRAEVFADFLDMAEHLLEQKYEDSAAVLVGGVLEGHLRKLCAKNNISTEWVDNRGRSRRKKVETMNTELAKAGVYSTPDQKNVTAWYGIRLDPAHGDYGKHTNEEIKVMLLGVREFVARHPA